MGSRVGAFGHSMGGSAATRIAEFGASSGVNIVAVVASHGAASVTNIDVPTLFTTGTLDTKDHDDSGNPNHFQHEFDICSAPTKIFVSLKGGYHMEPCDYMYSSDGLCARDDLQNCTIVKPEIELV